MDRPSGAAWPPALRRKLGIPSSAATAAPLPKVTKADAANDDDSDSDFDVPSPIVSSSSTTTTTSALSARRLRKYIHGSYAALTSIQRQLHRGEESYFEETYTHGNLFQGFDNIWIEPKHPISASAGGGESMDGSSSGSGGDANTMMVSSSKQPKSIPIRKMPSDYRWFSSSCGTILPTGDGQIAALERHSLIDRPPTPDVNEEADGKSVDEANLASQSTKVLVGPDAALSNKSSMDDVKVNNATKIITESIKPDVLSSSASLREKTNLSSEQPNSQQQQQQQQQQPDEQPSTKMATIATSSSLPGGTVSSETSKQMSVVSTQHQTTSASPIKEESPPQPTSISSEPKNNDSTSFVKPDQAPSSCQLDITPDHAPSANQSSQLFNSNVKTTSNRKSSMSGVSDPSDTENNGGAPTSTGEEDSAVSKTTIRATPIQSCKANSGDNVANPPASLPEGPNETMHPPPPYSSLPASKRARVLKDCQQSKKNDNPSDDAAPAMTPSVTNNATSGSVDSQSKLPPKLDSPETKAPSSADFPTAPSTDAASAGSIDGEVDVEAGSNVDDERSPGGRRTSSRVTRKRKTVS